MNSDVNKSDIVHSLNEIRRMSVVSNSSGFLQSFSLNSTGEASSAVKRKFADDSDFDGPSNKKESRLGSPLMSPWEFRRIRADLIDAQTQIVRLEDRIDQLHKKNKESVIFFDQEKSEMRTRLEASRKSNESLEHKLQRLRTREAEVRAELIELQRSHDTARLDRDERLAELESENAQLKERLGELEETEDERIVAYKQEIADLQRELQRQCLTSEEEHEQAESARARLAVALEDCRDMEELRCQVQAYQDKVRELETGKEEWEEARAVATVLQDRVLRLNDIEKELAARQEEVANLKIAIQNKVLVEDKLHDLELKQTFAAAREKEFIALKEKNFDLETELDRWGTLVERCCGGNTQAALLDFLAQLNEKELTYSVDKNALHAKLDKTTANLQAATDDLQAARKAAEEMKGAMDRMRTEVQLLRRKVALVTRERDSYRQQLDLFEKDLTVSGGKMGGEGEGSSQERVSELELMLQGYRDQMHRLEQQLALYTNDDVEARIDASRKLEQELAQARAECDRLSSRRDELEQMLEKRVEQGGHPSPSTRVLHFRNNPCAQAEEKQASEMAALTKQCDWLKARVRLLEAGERLDLTARSAADVESGSAAHVKELEEQLDSANLKNKRLKEVFKRTSQDFRDVSYMLLGYRIDLVSNRTYRLTNMYSEDPTHHFMFQLNKAGMMEMLETAFAETLSGLVNEHLLEKKSIPCFLSAVTLSLHNAGESASSERSEEPSEEEEEEEEEEQEEEEEDDEDRQYEPIEVELSD